MYLRKSVFIVFLVVALILGGVGVLFAQKLGISNSSLLTNDEYEEYQYLVKTYGKLEDIKNFVDDYYYVDVDVDDLVEGAYYGLVDALNDPYSEYVSAEEYEDYIGSMLGEYSGVGMSFYGNEALVDPFCGSGTIVIEAARTACGIAPGRDRHFAYEDLPYIGKEPYRRALQEALDNEDTEPMDDCYFFGSDIDPKAIESAKRNAEAAGVGAHTKFRICDASKMLPDYLEKLTSLPKQLVITNPPYGGRLMTPEDAAKIYKLIDRNYLTKDGYCKKGLRLSVITPENAFEEATGHKADKRVKLYNGAIVCTLSNYFKLGDKGNGNR